MFLGSVVAALGFLATATAAQIESTEGTTLIVAPGAEITLEPTTPTHRVEATLGGGLVVPVRGALRAPESGKHWLSVLSRDPAGNASEVHWYYVVVDDEAPHVELEFSKPPAADADGTQWLQTGSTVTTRAVDRLSGLAGVAIEAIGPDGAKLEKAGEVEAELFLESEGTYEIQAEATDVVKNRSEPLVATYHVDGEGPHGQVFAEGPHVEVGDLLVVGPGAEIRVEMGDERSGLVHWSAELDGEAIAEDDFHRGWSAGRHEAGAHLMDLVGNHTELAPRPFFFDDEGPEVSWEIENEVHQGCEDRPLVVPPVSLIFAAADTPAGVAAFETSTDGSTWTASEGRREVDGARLDLRATDAVGNVTQIGATWDLDLEAPRLALVGPDGTEHPPGASFDASNGDQLKIEIQDDGCIVPDVRYRYEDGRSIAASGRVIPVLREHCFIRPLLDRYCRITVEATDQFGRQASGVWRVNVARERSGSDT